MAYNYVINLFFNMLVINSLNNYKYKNRRVNNKTKNQ